MITGSTKEPYPQPPNLFAEASLDPSAGQEVLNRALRLPATIYQEDFAARGAFINATESIETVLRDTVVGQALSQLKDGSIVALTVTDLPVDPVLPPSPLDGGTPDGKKTFVSEGLAIGMARLLGHPSIILGEKKEALIHQITPVPGRGTSQSNEGQVDLQFHQDLGPNADLPSMQYHLAMPDWLILTGVRGSSQPTKTFIASVEEAVKDLSPETRQVLSQSRFIINPPESFLKAIPGAVDHLPTHPVLMDRGDFFEAQYDKSSLVRPEKGVEDTEALAALAEFDMALTQHKHEVVIEPGSAVAFNNRRVVHGRTAIGQEADPNYRRWIQRVYVYDVGRLAELAIGYPNRTLQLGGGLVRLAVANQPAQRLLELSKLT